MLNLNKNKRYLLACSFGPDSMALFDMLMKENISFEVAHVNYHLREESNEEQAQLEAYCQKNSIQLFVHNLDKTIDKNVEAVCRSIRYSFFAELFENGKYEAVLVAHNEDDLIETYLMQKTRKNLVKYLGIAEKTVINGVPIVRPLLSYTKNSLQEYCDKNNIPYSIDKSNVSRIYLRNRIRMDIVSKMNREDRDSLLKQIDRENLDLKTTLEQVSKLDNIINNLKALNNNEFAYYLDFKISVINPSFKLTHKCVDEIVNILHSSKPNISLNIGNEILIKKEYDRLIISSIAKEFMGYQFIINEPCVLDNEFFYLNFLGDTSNRNVSSNDYPLTIRTFQKGDMYQIKDYQVLVRRLFIDWKVPMSLRKRWPIILNKDNRIIYIPRYQKDFIQDSAINFYVK